MRRRALNLRRGRGRQRAAPSSDPSDHDVEHFTGGNRRRQVDGQESGKVSARHMRDGNVRDAARRHALDRVGVGLAEEAARVDRIGKRKHRARSSMRASRSSGCSREGSCPSRSSVRRGKRRAAPARDERLARPNIERLRRDVRRPRVRVLRQRDLQVSLGQLVPAKRARRGAGSGRSRDGGIAIGDLGDDAVVSAAEVRVAGGVVDV